MSDILSDFLGSAPQQPQAPTGFPSSLNDPRYNNDPRVVEARQRINAAPSMKAAFLQICNEKGVNPQNIFSQFLGR